MLNLSSNVALRLASRNFVFIYRFKKKRNEVIYTSQPLLKGQKTCLCVEKFTTVSQSVLLQVIKYWILLSVRISRYGRKQAVPDFLRASITGSVRIADCINHFYFYIATTTLVQGYALLVVNYKVLKNSWQRKTIKDVRAHCYCASLVRTLYMCHVMYFKSTHRVETQQNIELVTFAVT